MGTILSGITVLLCLICVRSFPTVINGHHVFRDFLIGDTACDGVNRLGEWKLFWRLLALGSVLTFLLGLWEPAAAAEKKDEVLKLKERLAKRTGKDRSLARRAGDTALCLLPLLSQLFFYGKTGGKMVFFTMAVAILMWLDPDSVKRRTVSFLCIYFALESIAVLLAVSFHNYFLGDTKVLAGALLLFFGNCVCMERERKKPGLVQKERRASAGSDRKEERSRGWILLQLLIPLLLLIYLKDRYQLQDAIVTVPFSKRYVAMIVLLIAALYAADYDQLRRQTGQRVFFSTVFSIFAFVSYMPPALLMQSDLHHHGEQILAWQQIVELGQKAYEQYSPASGFFPMLIGFFNSVLFHGQATEYAMSFVLMALLFEVWILYCLYRRIGGEWTLFTAVLFHMPEYCRTWILVPVLLLLADPKRIADRAKWLLAWVFLIYLAGLYYPLFGAALLIGTLPFGAVQVYWFLKNKDWKKPADSRFFIQSNSDKGQAESVQENRSESRAENAQEIRTSIDAKSGKRIAAGMGLIGLSGLILCSMPLLLRMLSHVLSMAGQTLDVDGLGIIGYDVPEWFMPYLGTWGRRAQIYYMMRFVLGIVFVMIAVYVLARYVKILLSHVWNRKETADLSEKQERERVLCAGLLPVSIPLILCVCYSYTMVCMDENWVGNILSRSDHVILFVSGMCGLVLLLEHGHMFLKKRTGKILLAITLSIPFVFFYECDDYAFPYLEGRTDGSSYTIGEYADKLLPYAVREEYVPVSDALKEQYPHVDLQRIGSGFIQTNVLENLETNAFTYDFLKGFDPKVRILGFEHTQFYYYLLNEKTVYSGRTAVARSKKAVERVLRCVDGHTVVRAGVKPFHEYYLYRYLMKQGYVYCKDLDLYLPPDLYRQIYGKDGSVKDSPWTQTEDCHYAPASFAKSLEQMGCFEPLGDLTAKTEKNMVILSEPADGAQADFLHVRLALTEEQKDVLLKQDGEESDRASDDEGVRRQQPDECKILIRFPTALTESKTAAITCNYADGDLLIPLGINAAWFLEKHSAVEFVIQTEAGEICPEIQEIQFYHLKDETRQRE